MVSVSRGVAEPSVFLDWVADGADSMQNLGGSWIRAYAPTLHQSRCCRKSMRNVFKCTYFEFWKMWVRAKKKNGAGQGHPPIRLGLDLQNPPTRKTALGYPP